MKTSCAVIAALFASCEAVKLDPFLGKIVGHSKEVYPFAFHENEDLNSVPAPLNNRKYMTSTQAKLISHGNDDLAHEPWGLDSQFHEPYNKYAPEPKLLQIEDSDSDSSSDSDSDDENDRMNVQWMVDADFGETDDQVVVREHDTGNGVKFSGWTNPIAWTDDGNDDDAILAQLKDEEDDEANVVTEEQQRTADQIATGGHAKADTIDGDDKVL